MKIINQNLAKALIGLSLFSMGCNQENEGPVFGSGDGKFGVALVLKNTTSNPNSRTMNELVIENGFIQIKEIDLEVEGRNENGKFEKEIEIEFDEIKKISFDRFDSSADFFLEIPAGEYKEIEFELDLIDHKNEPSIYLEGKYGDTPLIFEYYGDDIDFEVEIEADDDNYFKIDRINNPLALFEINATSWFSDLTSSELENAEIKDGKIFLTKQSNSNMYNKVKRQIEASSEIEIEIK